MIWLDPDSPTTTIGFYVFIGILIVVVIALIIYDGQLRVTKINPEECPKAVGEFGVQVQKSVTIYTHCGLNDDQPCIFPASNLKQAIDICNTGGCSSFIYDGRTVSYVDPLAPVGSGNSDLYTRQYPKIMV